jgi:serine/threonine-protein phosphatase 6 regulatory ankyrin repeat subunit B
MKYSKENVVVYLLQAGVDVNERDKNGYTVLAYAVSNKQNELVQILIDHGADVVTPGGVSFVSLLEMYH